MKQILMVVLAVTLAGGTAQAMALDPPESSHKATLADYRELLKMVRGLETSLQNLTSALGRAKDDPRPDCRGLSPEKTVRCGAEAFHPPGGVGQALAVWRCESGWGIEQGSTMGHSYHGPYQFLYSTYASQQASMPDVVEWYDLSPAVHDMRSNMLTAVAYAARHGWSAWSCA